MQPEMRTSQQSVSNDGLRRDDRSGVVDHQRGAILSVQLLALEGLMGASDREPALGDALNREFERQRRFSHRANLGGVDSRCKPERPCPNSISSFNG
jgi:hypothetical protein